MKRRLAVVALLGAIALAWAPALDAPFTYDDRVEVVGNRAVRDLADLGAIVAYNPSRPLLLATYALNWELGGVDPIGYHLLSLAIHGVNALLAWRLAARLLPGPRAGVVAALWALHPMTTEAVTYTTGRSDALHATAWLLALSGWIDRRRGVPRAGLLAGAGVVLALLTKETGWLLPLALAALDRWIVPGGRWRAHLWTGLLVALAVTVRVVGWGLPAAEVPRGPVAQVLTQAEVWVRYLALWLVPVGQSVLHDHPATLGPRGIAALGGLLTGASALIAAARRAPPGSPAAVRAFALVLGAAWLLPSSAVPLLETMAEHRAYLLGLAVAIALASAVPAALPPRARTPVVVLLGVALLGLAAATAARNRTWADEAALWADAAARNPASARAAYGLAEALRFQRRYAEALPAYERAVALATDDLDARIGLGIALAETGDTARARAAWEEVLTRDPRRCAAHNNLANLAFRAGRLEEAALGYGATLGSCPDDPLAHLNLANLAWARADVRVAAYHYRAFLRVADEGPAAVLARERLARLGVSADPSPPEAPPPGP